MPSVLNNLRNDTRDTNADDHINWRYQDKTYNEQFKNWRKQAKDSLGFYYVNNPNELTYRDGYGFVKAYPEAAEANALRHVFNVLGISLLLCALMDIMYIYVMPAFLNWLGFDIYYDFFGGTLYGNDWLILGLSFFFEIFKRVYPFLICFKTLKMPIRVMFPMKITNKPLFNISVPVMLLVSAVCAVSSALYNEVLGSVSIGQSLWMQIPEGKGAFIVSILLNIILIPIVSELCTRGVIMQLLRQFGDSSAIIFTAIISAAVSYDINQFCYMFITAVVIGYFTLRTGSVATAIIMRITARAFAYGMYMADHFLEDVYSSVVLMALLFLGIMIGLITIIWFMIRHGDKLGMTLTSRYLTFYNKSLIAVTNIPVVLWISATFILTILNLKIKY